MENFPLVSIILPSFNKAEYIRKAIESVLSQTYRNLELILIDDGSTDGKTPEILKEYEKKDARVKILTNSQNLGLTKSLNRGIREAACGKYIGRIDDDDVWLDEKKLEKQINFLEKNPDYVLVGGGIVLKDETGKELLRFFHPEEDKDIRKRLLVCNQFVHSAVVFKRDAYDRAGGYDESFKLSQDRDLWLKMGKIGKLHNFQEYFVGYIQGTKNITSNKWREALRLGNIMRERYKKDYPGYFASLFFSITYYFYNLFNIRKIIYPFSAKMREIFFNIFVKK